MNLKFVDGNFDFKLCALAEFSALVASSGHNAVIGQNFLSFLVSISELKVQLQMLSGWRRLRSSIGNRSFVDF